ncbi:MAG TPA: malto-oligosyltrehalose trehalohydrolase [Mycobacteriales bacterium]|nr:malto-oligosyltrehalose trehalohydrolase [Mycobacteriales bacterium]
MRAAAAPPTSPLGATPLGDGEWGFVVWAPRSPSVAVRLEGTDQADVPLEPVGCGYHAGRIEGLSRPPTYRFVLADGNAWADPASRRQPDGVHGPSVGFDPAEHDWHDEGFVPPPVSELVIYEMHVGTFTDGGTFDAAIEHLEELASLGITAVEPMPIAAFPGTRNWGYDGAFPYAVQESYGGPAGFQRFVDACHARGLAVILDVVYNHLGPEGTVHQQYGPYVTESYATPWGPAMNFSEAGSDEVRRYFVDNTLMWLRDFHVDGLRFDAVHGIVDPTASPFLRELTATVTALGQQLGRRFVTIAESADNNPLVVSPPEAGGQGFDAQWSDDFHHALHTVLTGERDGYYQDFGALDQLAAAYTHGFAYRGEYSRFRGRRHGCASPPVRSDQLVTYAQNHDQVGNRAGAERLTSLVGPDRAQLAVAATLLSPNVPLLFMGEEYAETAPFPYFVDHGDPALLEAVRKGRAAEFGRDADQFDPGDEATFRRARLDRSRRETPEGAAMLELVRRLLELRRSVPLLHDAAADASGADLDDAVVILRRRRGAAQTALLLNLGDQPRDVALNPPGDWRDLLEGGPLPGGRVHLDPWRFAVCAVGPAETDLA